MSHNFYLQKVKLAIKDIRFLKKFRVVNRDLKKNNFLIKTTLQY